MGSWEQLREHVRGKYKLAVDEDQRLGLLWTFPNAEGVQRQYVASVTALGVPHVMITSNVVPTTAMTAHDAMLHNAQLAVGALCIADGFLLLRAVLPIDGVDIAVIDRALETIAHEAARIRTKSAPKAAPAPYYE